ncbi:precorrin-2 C(20)-methyltransferase [Desulfolithobacter sp.]
MTSIQPKGQLFLVGVGPGDPELMTLRAVRVLRQAPVWLAPKGRKNGSSSALKIAASQVDTADKTIVELHFPMKKVRLGQTPDPELQEGWKAAAEAVLDHLVSGRDVAFPTLGDPALYSTAFYLLTTLHQRYPDVQATIIPGITAMAACSANVGAPLGLGDDVVSIVPAVFDDERLRDILTRVDAVVLMKVHRRLAPVVALLDELGITDQAVLVERCGMEDQKIYTDVREALGRDLHYFTTMLIRRRAVGTGLTRYEGCNERSRSICREMV